MLRLVGLLQGAGPDALAPEQVRELAAILEAAGVDLDADELDDEELAARLRSAIGIARLLVAVQSNVVSYASRASLRTGARLLEAVRHAESLGEVIDETSEIAREEFGRLGLDARRQDRRRIADRRRRRVDLAELRERGARLLERSAEVAHEETVHLAHARLVEELAPDEARILRMLARQGPQPAVDVRDRGLLGLGSGLLARNLTMLCVEAGCRHDDRQEAYVTNLRRLGLVRLVDDPLEDLERYPVLEAQPDVKAAMEAARRPKPVRRRVELTPLGVDFCETVLAIEVADAHRTPGAAPGDGRT